MPGRGVVDAADEWHCYGRHARGCAINRLETDTLIILGATENGRPEYGRSIKNTGWKMADVKKADQEIET